jgi:hypothetical protein
MNPEQLLESNEINRYFYDQIKNSLAFFVLPSDLKESYIEDAKIMSAAGVSSHEAQKTFYHIMTHTQDIILDGTIVSVGKIRPYMLPKIYESIYKNKDKYPIDTLIGFYFAVAAAIKDLKIEISPEINKRLVDYSKNIKLAYPEGWSGMIAHQPYDISRWMRATGDIYSRARTGEDIEKAFAIVTSNWDKMEQIDYKHWLRFYQEGVNQKYKTANYEDSFYTNPLEYSSLKANLPTPPKEELEPEEKQKEKSDVNDVRDTIEQQRSRIVSRLHAAEKLLASMEGQLFAGDDQETMLMLLQELKRKVQTANKIRIKSSLFDDFIYRTANLLNNYGKTKQAAFFYKIAQAPDADLGLVPPSPELPGVASPLMSEMPPPDANNPTKDAFKKFFALLETGVADVEEIKNAKADDEALIIVEAQAAPVAAPAAMPAEAPIEAELPAEPAVERVINEGPGTKASTNIDEEIETVLKRVSVADVVRRLDLLSGLFKRREIARQLAIIDLMLDKLGIGSFFPSLGEAARSNLESSQYIATRIEDILSKLRGSLETQKTEQMVEQEMQPSQPTETKLQRQLAEQQDKEKERKERRKAFEDAKAAGEAPETGVAAQAPEALKQPAQVQQAAPVVPR